MTDPERTIADLRKQIAELNRVKRDYKEALAMIETLAAAGARLTALAGGADISLPANAVQFASNDGMFSEEIAWCRITALCKEAKRAKGEGK